MHHFTCSKTKYHEKFQNIMKMVVADIKKFVKFFHPISHFQITFISAPVNVLKSNVIEFYLFLTTSSIDLMPPELGMDVSSVCCR